MRKCLLFTLILTIVVVGAANAENTNGRFGLTFHGGFNAPMNSELSSTLRLRDRTVDTDVGFIVGGGFLYGIAKNFAADLEITYSEVKGNYLGSEIAQFSTTDIAFGGLYHFSLKKEEWAPYLGAGIDVLINDAEAAGILSGLGSADAETTVGGHFKGGLDYCVTKNVALNAEFKILVSGSSEVTAAGSTLGDYKPTSFSGLFGLRFLFDNPSANKSSGN